jgi:ATP-dependent Clp protease ATP-binding subunit ClpC
MFERYTEKARRVIFFARYEASQFGSPYIETEHLLLGFLREDKALVVHVGLRDSIESIRTQIASHTTVREKIDTSVDLPLSNECKRVLAYAAEEAELLSVTHIGTEHLLLGLLREKTSFAAEILHERGLELSAVRQMIETRTDQRTRTPRSTPMLDQISRDLTLAAQQVKLAPLIGRNQELDSIIQILCSRNKKNPVLVGEHGSGKTAIIEGLAQRIENNEVPPFLSEKDLLALDLERVRRWAKNKVKFEEQMDGVIEELTHNPGVILYIDNLSAFSEIAPDPESLSALDMLKAGLLRCDIQCIATDTVADYQKVSREQLWIAQCFRPITISPLDEETTIRALFGRKEEYERFHAVSYTDDALVHAVRYSMRYFRDTPSLTKALEMLDASGSRVKLRLTTLPEEILEVQKRIRFIIHRMEQAIANHEFEKARFYSDEERKERENMRVFREEYHLDDTSAGVVGREDIEEVVSSWIGIKVPPLDDEISSEQPGAEASIGTLQAATPQKRETLRVFLCHSSHDKKIVRDLYQRLKENQIEPWLDVENLLPGQDWDYEIRNAIRRSHAVVVCISTYSLTTVGYLQKEIRRVLDVADEQPEGAIYVIPLKLEVCEVPSQLRRWHWVNFFEDNGFEKLMLALSERGRAIGISSQ